MRSTEKVVLQLAPKFEIARIVVALHNIILAAESPLRFKVLYPLYKECRTYSYKVFLFRDDSVNIFLFLFLNLNI